MARFVRVTERALTGKSSGWDFWFYFWELVEGVLVSIFVLGCLLVEGNVSMCIYMPGCI